MEKRKKIVMKRDNKRLMNGITTVIMVVRIQCLESGVFTFCPMRRWTRQRLSAVGTDIKGSRQDGQDRQSEGGGVLEEGASVGRQACEACRRHTDLPLSKN